ncbi:alpha/beta hydrolase [Austwickia chelonae]|uniref:alpha/beta hydrolase n=1 Tax=Austwickia chelonae TaxID=100225 RepID=UPI000E278EDC|nr:alpha/beta hydrolase [Austwickia chelonae]
MRTTLTVATTSVLAFGIFPSAAIAVPARTTAPSTAPAGPDMSKVKTPALKWAPCDNDASLHCAAVLLPLDYAKPDGPKIKVAVTKKPAIGKDRKGSLFVNPGGPGQSASERLPRLAKVLGTKVAQHFDIIGVDPRGIAPTAEARCWSKTPEPPNSRAKYPSEPDLQKLHIAHDDYERTACDKTGRPIIDHMSTASTVRDHEMIRRALGDKQFNYYGVSYGTYLGATYAALFPQTVGRMVMDSVVDPLAWSTGEKGEGEKIPVTGRIHSAEGSLETLNAAFAECKKAGPKRCPQGPTIEKAWKESVELLKKGPVKQGSQTHYLGDLVHNTAAAMYDDESFPRLMESIHEAWKTLTERKKPTVTLKQTAEEAQKKSIAPQLFAAPDNTAEKAIVPGTKPPKDAAWTDTFRIAGVMCSDTANPKDPQAWVHVGNSPEAQKNPFRASWAWDSSLCARWPGQDKNVYRGPFNVKPANPMLVLNNTHDPATPMAGAKKLVALSPGARLLAVDAWGHMSADKNTCAAKAAETYLVDGKLPAEGAVCKTEGSLFPEK